MADGPRLVAAEPGIRGDEHASSAMAAVAPEKNRRRPWLMQSLITELALRDEALRSSRKAASIFCFTDNSVLQSNLNCKRRFAVTTQIPTLRARPKSLIR
jgi:hypothetical protein